MLRPFVYASVSGGGPAITYLAGAAAALDARACVRGWSGASAGAIVAACKAFGVPDETIKAILAEVLGSGTAITADPMNLARGGLFDLRVIGELLRKHVGPNATMGEATTSLVIGVTDLDQARPLYLTKVSHPGVRIDEACIASSSFMCAVTPAAEIPSLSLGAYTPGVKLWGDGGLTDNTVDGVWDAKQEPRVCLRLADTDSGVRVRPGDVVGILAAIPRALLWAASQPKSKRTDGLVVDVDGANDWAFKKDVERVDAEWRAGYDSVSKHAPWLLAQAQ